MLDRYHAELLAHGVTGYDRRALDDDYRLSVLWQIATPVWQAAYDIPPWIWWNNLERTFLAVEDLGCRELLGGQAHRAGQALDADLAKYLPLWKLAVPAEFASHPWDFAKFGRGERFYYRALPREEFDATLAQVERWGLDQFLKDRSYETLSYAGIYLASRFPNLLRKY